ncbi:hypothetical protein J6590_036270 [Homalodisca vitripennis]|nr:hypothetical protein J6590_036270 [Homalodisca vitripennis]
MKSHTLAASQTPAVALSQRELAELTVYRPPDKFSEIKSHTLTAMQTPAVALSRREVDELTV